MNKEMVVRDAIGNELVVGDYVRCWNLPKVEAVIVALIPPRVSISTLGFGNGRRSAQITTQDVYPSGLVKLEPEELI